jgi:hemoglobin-like flavoprotein
VSLDIPALEQSFDHIAPRGDELVDEFYRRLFIAAPAVRALFPGDLRRQQRKLLEALVMLRGALRDLDAIAPALRELGARHVRYGARPEHYGVVGAVLLGTMAAIAGEAWTPEYDAAWSEALTVVAGLMLEGAGAVAA